MHTAQLFYCISEFVHVYLRIGVTTFTFPQWTPLHWVADNGNVETATLLVEKGADINVRDSFGVCESVLLSILLTAYQCCLS